MTPVVQFDSLTSTISEGTATLVISVSIQNADANPTSVDVNIMGGASATSGIDFGYAPVTITFPGGSSAPQNMVVTLNDDAIAEGNESFTLQLAFPTNSATIGTNAQHTVTLIDNDTSKLNIDFASFTRSENAGIVFVPVTLTTANVATINTTVHFNAAGSSATMSSDFDFTDTTLTWLAGDTGTKNFSLTIFDDNKYELTETVQLHLLNTTGAAVLLMDTFLLSILDNETLPSGNCSDLYFSEYIHGSANNKAIEIYNPTNTTIDLSDYKIFKSQNGNTGSIYNLSGSLNANAVYLLANPLAVSALTNLAYATSSFFDFDGNDAIYLLHLNDTIDVIGQSWIDPGANGWAIGTGSTNQHTLIRSFYHYHGNNNWDSAALWWNSFAVDMFDSLGAHHTAACGTGVPFIPATIRFTKGSDTIMEQNATYYFGAIVENQSGYIVHYSLFRDDAASTSTQGYATYFDYEFAGGSYNTDTSSNMHYDSLHIVLHDDAIVEGTEKIIIRVENVSPNGIAISDSVFTLYILDNDSLTSSFYGAGFGYVEKDTDVLVPIILSSYCADSLFCTDTIAQVRITLDIGSAIPGVDFLFVDTIITFKTNRADTLGARVHIFDDAAVEGNDQINFNLTNLNPGIHTNIIGYTLTIIDNDTPVGFSEEAFDVNMKLYPNPASNFIIISTEKEFSDVRITDLMGTEVLNIEKLSLGKNQIDISMLASGMYFVCVNDSGQIMSKRLVKSE
ncbi:MAG: T9SS type A sorting domain-containing protein [Bacteroidetes bacterium]|nr:T9SS type A sorting domain-containing protein [Bacteroidota bacterium]